MTRLSVNINKIATIRNARGGNLPDVILAAQNIERFGGQGITVHPRPDERHITRADVYALKEVVATEFNIEGNPTPEFMNLVLEVKPHQVTLVPDAPDVLTSNAGWDTVKYADFLREVIGEFKSAGIRTSIFIDPAVEMIEASPTTGTDRVELYTEAFAAVYATDREAAIAPYREAAQRALSIGLGVNAGHDLNLANLKFFKDSIGSLDEVSIGHALISDALYLGMEETISRYLEELK